MDRKDEVLNFRVTRLEKRLLAWYCSSLDIEVGARIRDLIQSDVEKAKKLVMAMPDGVSEPMDRLKRSVASNNQTDE